MDFLLYLQMFDTVITRLTVSFCKVKNLELLLL